MQWPIADMSWIVPHCFRYKFDDIRGLLRIIRFWSPSLNSSYGAQPWSWSNTSNNQLCFFITTDKFDGGWIFLSRHYSPSRYHDKKYQLMKDFIVVLVRFSRNVLEVNLEHKPWRIGPCCKCILSFWYTFLISMFRLLARILYLS